MSDKKTKHYWRHFKAGNGYAEFWELVLSNKDMHGDLVHYAYDNKWVFKFWEFGKPDLYITCEFLAITKTRAMEVSLKILTDWADKRRVNDEA